MTNKASCPKCGAPCARTVNIRGDDNGWSTTNEQRADYKFSFRPIANIVPNGWEVIRDSNDCIVVIDGGDYDPPNERIRCRTVVTDPIIQIYIKHLEKLVKENNNGS